MELYLKAGEDGQTVGDCPFAHYVRLGWFCSLCQIGVVYYECNALIYFLIVGSSLIYIDH